MRPYQFSLLAFLVIALMFSCKTEEDPFDRDLGFGYMALEVGRFIEYQVDSTIYDPTGDSMVFSTHSYLRDVIVDTLRDNIGSLLFKTERFYRRDSLSPWQIQKVYTQSIEGNQGIVTEDNLRFIKLAFPILVFNAWNPLVHIDPNTQIIVAGETLELFLQEGIWRSRILAANEPDTVGGFYFEELLTLREVNTSSFDLDTLLHSPESIRTVEDDSPIELRISYEQYAKDVGLVFRERWILDSDKCQQACNPLEISYNQCFENCFNNCITSGSSDSTQCETQCTFVDCNDQYQAFINCKDNCDSLPWLEKATKGFVMRMTVIRYN